MKKYIKILRRKFNHSSSLTGEIHVNNLACDYPIYSYKYVYII